MGKPDVLARGSGEQKFEMDAHLFKEGQLLDLEYNDIDEEEDAEDVELEEIDVVIQERKNRLWAVPQEHRLEGVHQHYDS